MHPPPAIYEDNSYVAKLLNFLVNLTDYHLIFFIKLVRVQISVPDSRRAIAEPSEDVCSFFVALAWYIFIQ